MRLLIYPFALFFIVIFKNPIKSIALVIISILTYITYFTSVYDNIKVDYKIVDTVHTNGKYYYLFEPNDNGDFESIASYKPIVFKNNIYTQMEGKEQFYVLGTILWIFIILFLIFMINAWSNDEDDALWEFSDCCEDAFCILIKCELEDGFYHYMALGRLIDRRNQSVDVRYLRVNSFSRLLNCPKFKTKKQKRSTVLNKLV